MLNLFFKKTITVLSSLALSLSGVIFVPANQVQAAVFRLTIDGLVGSGEIGFNDASLFGLPTESVYGYDLIDGYFNWNFGGTGTAYSVIFDYDFYEYFDENGESYWDYQEVYKESYSNQYVSTSSSLNNFEELSAFLNAEFIFKKGELVGINNYIWSQEFTGYSPYESYESLRLDNNSARFDYSVSDSRYPAGGSYLNTSGAQQFATITPWKQVPEPRTTAASLLVILFFITTKTSSRSKKSQESDKN